MVSILPANRSPLDAMGEIMNRNVSAALPNAVQQGYQRQLGLNALDQAEQAIGQAGNDPYKIALAFARAGAQNPSLERALGPLMQTALTRAQTDRAFPNGNNPTTPNLGTQPVQPNSPVAPNPNVSTPQLPYKNAPSSKQGSFATPSFSNIMTNDQIDAESKRYALAVNDPNAYQTRQVQLQNQNKIATEQREALEDLALKAGVTPKNLPRFMQVGQEFDPKNPTEWVQNTQRRFQEVQSNDKKIEREFIPGLGSGLLGRNRDETLKRLIPTIQDQVALGLEQETREYLADQYLSPTEIEELIHPLQPEQEKAIKSLPSGRFQQEDTSIGKAGLYPGLNKKKAGMSYEEALEKEPQKLEQDQQVLSDFFLNNVTPKSSLLAMREKIWKDKNYDWRQFGPAIRQAQAMGLELEPFQSTEMADIETNPPIQSIPDIFRDFDRVVQYFRGNK